MIRTLTLVLPLAALSSACAGSLSGNVGGEAVPSFADACLLELETDQSAGVTLIATSFGGGCNTVKEVQNDNAQIVEDTTAAIEAAGSDTAAIQAALDDQTEKLQALSARIPVDSWQVSAGLSAASLDAIEGDFDMSNGQNGSVLACHQEGSPDFDETSGADKNRVCFVSVEGTLQVKSYNEGQALELASTGLKLRLAADAEAEPDEVTLAVSGSTNKELTEAVNRSTTALVAQLQALANLSGQ